MRDALESAQDLYNRSRAAAAYEEATRRAEKLADNRQVAVGKTQLGTVRLLQQRYREALAAYEQALYTFDRLDEPGSVAMVWHQIGMTHQETGQFEAAERAYLKSLFIKVRHDDAGQASTLNQLGNLYDRMDRLEDAARIYRQAADKAKKIGDAAGESVRLSNLADTLRKLGRIAEARTECHQAIALKKPYGHASEPWKTWGILCEIETADGQAKAAAAAQRKAVELFLAYRRDGGENHAGSGRLCAAMVEMLLAGQANESALKNLTL